MVRPPLVRVAGSHDASNHQSNVFYVRLVPLTLHKVRTVTPVPSARTRLRRKPFDVHRLRGVHLIRFSDVIFGVWERTRKLYGVSCADTPSLHRRPSLKPSSVHVRGNCNSSTTRRPDYLQRSARLFLTSTRYAVFRSCWCTRCLLFFSKL